MCGAVRWGLCVDRLLICLFVVASQAQVRGEVRLHEGGFNGFGLAVGRCYVAVRCCSAHTTLLKWTLRRQTARRAEQSTHEVLSHKHTMAAFANGRGELHEACVTLPCYHNIKLPVRAADDIACRHSSSPRFTATNLSHLLPRVPCAAKQHFYSIGHTDRINALFGSCFCATRLSDMHVVPPGPLSWNALATCRLAEPKTRPAAV
jgi:hypothetical protein